MARALPGSLGTAAGILDVELNLSTIDLRGFMIEFRGRCACGEIVFTITGPVGDVVACHCRTCRRASGFVWAAVECSDQDLAVSGDTLAWWASSEFASRGFCAACGSSLFFKQHETGRTSVAPGVIDTPLAHTVARHIFCAEAGDYYRLADGVPQHDADA